MEEALPVLRVTEAPSAVSWYRRLGYEQEWEHRFEPGFPAFVSLARAGAARLFLSEHSGDATPNTLVHLRVDDLVAVAREFGVEIIEQPWGREVWLSDPDGNRLRLSSTV
jgi:Glyoxalase superfamily protein